MQRSSLVVALAMGDPVDLSPPDLPPVPVVPPYVPAQAAADPVEPEAPPPPPLLLPVPEEEMIVFGEDEVEEARELVEADLDRMGYRPGVRRGRWTVLQPPERWYPTIWLHDEGFLVMRRPVYSTVSLWLWGDLGKAKAKGGTIVTAIHPEVRRWQAALVGAGMAERYAVLPDLLDGAWHEGLFMLDGRTVLDTPEARRQDVLAFWATRADTPEGRRVRDIVAAYVIYEIQASEWPATAEELAAANARCACEPLPLP